MENIKKINSELKKVNEVFWPSIKEDNEITNDDFIEDFKIVLSELMDAYKGKIAPNMVLVESLKSIIDKADWNDFDFYSNKV